MAKSMVVAELKMNRLPEITAALRPRASGIVRETAGDIKERAQASMTGPKSGRIYQHRRQTKRVAAKLAAGKKLSASDYIVHQASAPGEAPAIDTNALRDSIQVEMEPGSLTATVGTNVEYAPYLEFGTSKMAPRPFMTPAAEAVRPGFEAAMKKLFE